MHAARPRQFWALFASASGATLAILVVLVGRSTATLMPVLLVAVAAAIFEASPVMLQEESKVTLSVIVLFAAIAYGGAPLALVAAIATGVVAGVTSRSDRLIKGVMNTSMSVLEAAGAAAIFSLIVRAPLYAPQHMDALARGPVVLSIGMLTAGALASLINAVLLGGVLHTASGVPYGRTIRELAGSLLVLQFVYVGLATIAYVLLVKTGMAALLVLTVPLLVARRSLLSVQERQDAYDRMVRAFVKAIELKDGYTRGHAERVSDLSVLVAERMGLSYEERQLIRYGAILHDVGKIGVSLGILCKAGPLDDDEFAEMKLHPEIGAEMLRDIDFLQPALTIVHHHHERVDGRGYPEGLEGEDISLLTRVVTAVDAFDAMTSTRSYRRALPVEVALEELLANAGTQFDAEVVGHLVATIREEGWEVTDEPVAVTPAFRTARVATS